MRYVIKEIGDVGKSKAALKCIKNKMRSFYQTFEKNIRYKQKNIRYKQQVYNESLFSISMVPIQIFCGIGDNKTIIWKNPVTSYTRYCRPINLVFAKESTDSITNKYIIKKRSKQTSFFWIIIFMLHASCLD